MLHPDLRNQNLQGDDLEILTSTLGDSYHQASLGTIEIYSFPSLAVSANSSAFVPQRQSVHP